MASAERTLTPLAMEISDTCTDVERKYAADHGRSFHAVALLEAC